MSTSNASRKETERTKLMQDKCQTLLTQMLRDDDNKYCVDCDAKGKYTHTNGAYLHIHIHFWHILMYVQLDLMFVPLLSI